MHEMMNNTAHLIPSCSRPLSLHERNRSAGAVWPMRRGLERPYRQRHGLTLSAAPETKTGDMSHPGRYFDELGVLRSAVSVAR